MTSPREIRGKVPLVLRAWGQQRRDLAELILDLDDLVHVATSSSDPVTPKTFERIRAERDAASADKAFYRIQAFLGARGIRFEKTYCREAPGEVVLEFDVPAVRELIRREVAPACRVLRDDEAHVGLVAAVIELATDRGLHPTPARASAPNKEDPMPREKVGELVTVFTEAHPTRADSPEDRRTRDWLMKTSGGCFICGGPVDLSHSGVPGDPKGLEDHHGGGIFVEDVLIGFNLFPLEWSMGWGADPKRVAAFVRQLRAAKLTTYDAPITDTKGVMAWVDSIYNANAKLCRAHHIGHQTEHSPDCNGHEAVGIHNAPWPIVAAQATCDWDNFDMWAGTTGTVAVSPDAERRGGTVVHYVHDAHPVKLKIGDRLPSTHPHSRAAHNGYRKQRRVRSAR